MKKTHIIFLLLISAGIALVATRMGNFSAYVGFDDARLNQGKTMKIVGYLVKEKEVLYQPEVDPNAFSFYMLDQEGNECKVICVDDKPQDFERTDEIVLTGQMRDSIFYANHILVKCPSKYTEEEIEKT